VSAGPVTFLREPLGAPLEVWQAPLLVRDDPRPFALLGAWAGGSRAVAGSCPVRVAGEDEDPFALLDEQPRVAGPPAPAGAVGGGWAGMLAFGLARGLEEAGGPPPRPAPLPLAALARYDHVLRCDRDGGWWLEALVAPGREEAVAERFAQLRARALAGPPAPRPVATAPWRWEPSPDGHARAVAACVERIAAGDLFQANLCLRLSSTLRAGEAVDVFARTWRELRPVQAAWVAGPWGAVASLSPESFLRRAGRRVQSAPIKGTRPRTGPPEADAEARAELLASAKDGAEHVMIVDLVRNDLGRVCVPGSVRVAELAGSRPAPGVWHLVSTVEGELRPGIGDAELLRASFPPGSVTGAPKVAALRAIGELESTGREAYTGALGLASPLAGLDLNVAIRTFEVRGTDIWLGAGGGVVADSDGVEEAREAAAKAAPLLAAIGAAPAAGFGDGEPQAPRRPLPVPPRLGPVPLPRPDPASGVFETLRVQEGRPCHVAAHLARLAGSVRALFGLALPEGLEAALGEAARGAPDPGRLRLDVWLGDGGLRTSVTVSALPPAPPPRLRAVCVPGGLGPHKLRDRRLWDALAGAHPGELVLAVDLDGHVLETGRAAVLAELDGVLVAPPADGRILPGIARARLLAAARAQGRAVAERPLALAELARADPVLLAGALRGVERAETLDGVPLAGAPLGGERGASAPAGGAAPAGSREAATGSSPCPRGHG
jgi:para-aminobenzoate synthetase/4-amino-4-deoxychorismate lyase